MNCQKCKKTTFLLPKHKKAGEFQCYNCKHINKIFQCYNESIMDSISTFGKLVSKTQLRREYSLTSRINTIGRSNDCDIAIGRIEHNGKCYISNIHYTIKVALDIWKGQLRYQISDGTSLNGLSNFKPSTNGTFINDYKLQNSEVFDIPENGIINLGGADEFTIIPYIIPQDTLLLYKISIESDTDFEMTL